MSIVCHKCVEDSRGGALKRQPQPAVIKTCRHFEFAASRTLGLSARAQLQFGLIAQTPERGSGCKVVAVGIPGGGLLGLIIL